MFKLDLEKAEESEIKSSTFVRLQKKQGNSKRSIYFCFTDYPKAFVWITTDCGKFLKEMGNTRPPYLPPEKPVCRLRSNNQNRMWNNGLVPNWKRNMLRLHIVTLLFNLFAEYIMWNARLDGSQAGIKIARRNVNNLRYADETTIMAEN